LGFGIIVGIIMLTCNNVECQLNSLNEHFTRYTLYNVYIDTYDLNNIPGRTTRIQIK